MNDESQPEITGDVVEDADDAQIDVESNANKKVIYQLTTPSVETLHDRFKDGIYFLSQNFSVILSGIGKRQVI